MSETYQGILRDNRIEWIGDAPRGASGARAQVTILEPVSPDSDEQSRRQRMVAALERLAAMGGLPGIPDPVAWQREMREDRPLAG